MAGKNAATLRTENQSRDKTLTETVTLKIDCSQRTPHELATQLRDSQLRAAQQRSEIGEVKLELTGLEANPGLAGLCSGLTEHITVQILGNVGDFCFLLGAEAILEIRGHAGDCLGHSMISGHVTVHGNAGKHVAAYAKGGFVAVLGQAGDGCAAGLSGADVLIRSRVGDRAGWCMRGGTLLLGNGAGEELGAGMTGGVIYVRGEVKSKSNAVRLERFKEADSLRLSLLLARAGIKASGADFKIYRPKADKV